MVVSSIHILLAVKSYEVNILGCSSDSEASQLLEICNGNLAMAADLYFQQRQLPSSSADSPEVVFVGGSRRAVSSRVRITNGGASGSRLRVDETEMFVITIFELSLQV